MAADSSTGSSWGNQFPDLGFEMKEEFPLLNMRHAVHKKSKRAFTLVFRPKGHETEVDVLDMLSHANIPRLHSTFDQAHERWLVLDFVVGSTLADRLAILGSLSDDQAVATFSQVFAGLEYLHENGVVHVSICPMHVVFASASTSVWTSLKLVNFSNSLFVGEEVGARVDRTAGATRGGDSSPASRAAAAGATSEQASRIRVGPPEYRAPEIVLDLEIGRPVDVWACGVMIFIALSGFPPFYEDSVERLNAQIVETPHDCAASYFASVSPHAVSLIDGLLCKNPDKRLTSAQARAHGWFAPKPSAPGVASSALASAEARRAVLATLALYRFYEMGLEYEKANCTSGGFGDSYISGVLSGTGGAETGMLAGTPRSTSAAFSIEPLPPGTSTPTNPRVSSGSSRP